MELCKVEVQKKCVCAKFRWRTKNVLCIPSYRQNIFSILAATEKGATVNFSPTSAELVAPNGSTSDIRKSGKLYYLNSVANHTGKSHSLKEWHMILGHCNVKDVIKLESVDEGMTSSVMYVLWVR